MLLRNRKRRTTRGEFCPGGGVWRGYPYPGREGTPILQSCLYVSYPGWGHYTYPGQMVPLSCQEAFLSCPEGATPILSGYPTGRDFKPESAVPPLVDGQIPVKTVPSLARGTVNILVCAHTARISNNFIFSYVSDHVTQKSSCFFISCIQCLTEYRSLSNIWLLTFSKLKH